MRIIGVGIDIVDIDRVRALPHFDRAAEFVFNETERLEMRRSRDEAQYFATRFALKEAVIKALPNACGYRDISIAKDGTKLRADLGKKSHSYTVALSVSHELKYAVGHAMVIAYE